MRITDLRSFRNYNEVGFLIGLTTFFQQCKKLIERVSSSGMITAAAPPAIPLLMRYNRSVFPLLQ
jgi:hypothetical protein